MRYTPKMLLHIGMADAYAMAVEYVKMPENKDLLEKVLKLDQYYGHPRFPGLKSLYTDDTEMSCANTKVILEKGPYGTKLDYANAYVEEFIRGGRRKGYSKGFQALLESVSSGEELLEIVIPNSTKNGAAMRAVPFGVLPDVRDACHAATIQASVTHDTTEGRFSAKIVAAMAHFSLYEDRPLTELSLYLEDFISWEHREQFGHILKQDYPYHRPVTRGKYSVAINTVHAVLTILQKEKSLIDMLRAVLRIGGDTDSVAALIWGIASPRFREHNYYPPFMEIFLESRSAETGAEYLLDLGKQLMLKYGTSPVQRCVLNGWGHESVREELVNEIWIWWLDVDGGRLNHNEILERGVPLGERSLKFIQSFRPFLPHNAEEHIYQLGTDQWVSCSFPLDTVKDFAGAEKILREFFPRLELWNENSISIGI